MQDNPETRKSLPAGVWQILTLKCDAATRLVSDGFERDLGLLERAALRMHLMICRPCRRMRAQFALLHEAGSRLARSHHTATEGTAAPQTDRDVDHGGRPSD